jgi:hypothetical protein
MICSLPVAHSPKDAGQISTQYKDDRHAQGKVIPRRGLHLDESLAWSEAAFKVFVQALAGRVKGLSDLVGVYRQHHPAYRELVARIAATDRLIDQLAYKLYGLTEEEIAVVGQGRPLLDCRDCAPLEIAGAELGDVQVYAQQERDARRLLADPVSREVLARLLRDQEGSGFREVYLQPGSVWLRARPRQVTEGRFRQWFDDALALAEAGEKALVLPR